MSVEEEICKINGLAYGELVGSGAFKDTHKVYDHTGRSLALKVCNSSNTPARLTREVDAMMACQHANIARLEKAESFSAHGADHYYMLEEFIEGVTLENRIDDHLLARDETVTIARSLITAVAHMAELDLVHRDLKPANIILREGTLDPVVVDFGIVRNLGETSLTKTFISQGPGTPLFAPPEQLNNEKHLIDWRADQFSLGVTASIAMSGLHPYAVSTDTEPAEVVALTSQRQGPSKRFLDWATEQRVEPLIAMVSPWPANRMRTPATLDESWEDI